MREPPATAVRASPDAEPARELPPLRYRRGIAIATVAAFVMTVLGAFGTDSIAFPKRLAFFLVVFETGALLGIGVSTAVRGWGRLVDRPLVEGALVSLVIALPLTLAVFGATLAFFDLRPPTPAQAAVTFAGVFVVTCAVTAINYMRGVTTETPATPVVATEPPPAAAPAPPPLLDRLPPHLRIAELHALEAEDHYLRVHTSLGSALILMRMGDAITEVGAVDGARTHRSWWVARAAVHGATRRGDRGELTLPGGIVAPVSRAALKPLHVAGWFAARSCQAAGDG